MGTNSAETSHPLSSLGPHPPPRAPGSYVSLHRPEQRATPPSTTLGSLEKSKAREERRSLSAHDLRMFQKREYSKEKRQRQSPSVRATEADVGARERAPQLCERSLSPPSTALSNSPPRFTFFQSMSQFSIFIEAAVVQ